MAVLEGWEIGRNNVGLFIGILDVKWMAFGVQSARKGVAWCRRIRAQVKMSLNWNNFNLRHLNCGVVDIGERGI